MGPYPHDAPPPTISPENPDGDGRVRVRRVLPSGARPRWITCSGSMGFDAVAKHRTKRVTLYRQGRVNLVVNAEPGSFAARFAEAHGPSAPAMAFRVVDARVRLQARAVARRQARGDVPPGPTSSVFPPSRALGGLHIYLVDRYGAKGSIYDVDFEWIGEPDPSPPGAGLWYIDHLTHNVHRGRLDEWAGFYERLFNFRQIRYFDIAGRLTGLHSRAMTSPDGKIRIPINEDAGEHGQIAEYLQQYQAARASSTSRSARRTSTRRSRR